VVALWRTTYDYLENDQGIHNLVWLFESGQPDVDVTSNYPGDAYVDIVGQDVYMDTPGAPSVVSAYHKLVSTGKLVCMSEFGAGSPKLGNRAFDEDVLVKAFHDQMPRTVFFVQWWDANAGRVGWGMASTSNVRVALSRPWILNRDDLPHGDPQSP
jgi:mannan endo-1,4-beta-mannosidase